MVFSAGEHQPVSGHRDVRFILDGGGNVGNSAAWFLATLPGAVVCSIEPDPENVQLLRRNRRNGGVHARHRPLDMEVRTRGELVIARRRAPDGRGG